MKVLIGGSRGFVGQSLVKRLQDEGHQVVRLVRDKAEDSDVLWNPDNGALDPLDLEGFDAVVHLGGVGIGEKRWTKTERGRIWDSRINSTDFLAQRIAQVIDRPKVFVVASGIGYYGNRGDERLTETSTRGEGFLAEVCYHWEDAAAPAVEAAIRTVHIRSGIVLGAGGGMFKRLAPMFRTAMGGKLGSGSQYMSWITLHDEVSAIMFAISKRQISGPMNVCSPNPVTNSEFTKAMGDAFHRPTFIPIWPWMLKLGFGSQLTEEMLLASQRAYPKKLEHAGFEFRDRHLAAALRALVEEAKPAPRVRPDSPAGKKKKKLRVPKMFQFNEPQPAKKASISDDITRPTQRPSENLRDEETIDLNDPDNRG